MNLPGFERPVFVARVLNNEFKYIDNYPQFDGVIMDANLANHYSNPWGRVIEKRDKGGIKFLMVDPNTAKMEHRVCIQKKTYRQLSYCPDTDPLIPDDFLSQAGGDYSEQFCRDVITTQVDLGADVILTPYFVAKTVNSPWYQVNISNVQKTIDVRTELGVDNPLFAVICVSIAELTNQASRHRIVQDYRNLDVNGYYLLAEGLSDRVSGTLELSALLALVRELSDNRKPLLVGSIDAFGLFTPGFGSAGFSAGICWLESFNEQNFTLELEGRNEDAMRERFFYIPETLIKFPRDRAQLIYQNTNITGISSNQNSIYYNQRTIGWDDRARYYFLEKRYDELINMSGMTDIQKKQHMGTRLDVAIDIARQIAAEDIQIRAAHLTRWKDATL